jgi:CRISPR-associated protein Cst1
MTNNLIYPVTGNPFVDTGQAVIACLAGKESFTQMNHDDVKRVFGVGDDLSDWNSRLKSFTMVFGNNGPLYQPRGEKFEETRKRKYSLILSGLLDQMENINHNSGMCECCGEFHAVDINAAYEQVDDDKVSDHVIGRDLFPLIGSLGSDAQALPSSSRMFNICPRCLFAVSYIPIGTRLLSGKLMVFEGAHQPFVQDLIKSIIDDNRRLLSVGGNSIETIGKKRPSSETVKWLCTVFRDLQNAQKIKALPKNSELHIWLFSNSGTNPSCEIISIPDESVRFLWEAARYGLENEIASLATADKSIKNSDNHLLNSIRNKIDYMGLYPIKKYDGASVNMFAFYQTRLLGIPYKTLITSQKLAEGLLPDNTKEQKEWIKSDVFNDAKKRNILKGRFIEMVEDGRLSIDDYFQIFPVKSLYPLQASFKGFDMIRYFLRHADEDIPNYEYKESIEGESVKMNPNILAAADLYFNDYIENRGLKRFKKDVLDEFKSGTKHVYWIKNMMCDLSEHHEGFGPDDWDSFWHDLCHDENGNFAGYELLFQMRLALTDLYRKKIQENITMNPEINQVGGN